MWTRIIGTTVGVITAGLSAKYPQYATELVSISTFLFGWLHIPQPQTN